MVLLLGAGWLLLRPPVVWAHEGEPVTPRSLWHAWSWEPGVLLGLALSVVMYAVGVWRLWRRAGIDRGVQRWHVATFSGGLLAVVVALISPLDALGGVLFAGHMAQHIVLSHVAAPLLVLGAPLLPLLWALPLALRRRLSSWWLQRRTLRAGWHVLTHPIIVWILYVGALWLWHIPALYEATLRSDWIHTAQHSSFFGTALLFWWLVAQPIGRRRVTPFVAVALLFLTMLQNLVLSAFILLAQRPWYPSYAPSATSWGLTALEDQRFAGLIMMLPADLIHLAAALTLAALGLREVERRALQRERSIQAAATVAVTE